MSILSKAIDKVTTVKTRLKHIIKSDKDDTNVKDNCQSVIDKITDIGNRVNNIIIRSYQLLRCFLLYCFENNIKPPMLDENFISLSFKVIMTEQIQGPKLGEQNAKILKILTFVYTKYKEKFNFGEKINGQNLSQILGYTVKSMMTAIKNNITFHFCDHLKIFVNAHFNERITKFRDKYDKGEINKQSLDRFIKELRSECKVVQKDLIDGTNKSDYDGFIIHFRAKYLPQIIETSLMYDLNKNPLKYMPYMIAMCRHLEEKGHKQLQFFPLRNEKVIKYFPIDTKIIIEILMTENKGKCLSKLTENQEYIWKLFFNLDNPIFKRKEYEFKYLIYTNGYSVSIIFDHNSQSDKIKLKKENITKGRQLSQHNKKNLSIEDNNKLKKQKPVYNPKLKSIKAKEEYKKLPKEEKAKLTREKNKLKKEADKKHLFEYMEMCEEDKKILDDKKEQMKRERQPEFPYIDELTEKQITELSKTDKVYIDPGKIRLLTMLGDNGKFLTYSNKQRLKETKRGKYNERLNIYRNKEVNGESIQNTESLLNDYNSKSCFLDKFLEYVHVKNATNKKLIPQYASPIFRQLKFYSYINKQRTEQKLITNIKKVFGDNVALMYGDWSIPKQMRNYMSTPMIGLKRRLSKEFDIINIDEYNTSKLNYITEEPNENLVIPIKNLSKNEHAIRIKNKKKKKMEKFKIKKKKKKKKDVLNDTNMVTPIIEEPIQVKTETGDLKIGDTIKMGLYRLHSVLTYKMENNRLGCVNRDRNAIYNIKKIVDQWLLDRTRPVNFRRESCEPIIKKTVVTAVKSRQISQCS